MRCQVGKTREAIGLDGEVVNRRRTISGPVTELVEAARREQPTLSAFPSPSSAQVESAPPKVNSSPPNPPSSPHPSSGGSGSSSENLPFADEGSLTIRRQGRGEGEGEGQVAIYIRLSMHYVLQVCSASTFCSLYMLLTIYKCFFECLCNNNLLS